MNLHHKHGPVAAIAYETAGLRWLAQADGAAVVDIVAISDGVLTLPRLRGTRPSPGQAAEFGARLAHTHDAGASAFGSPPPGWTGQGFIGSAPMTLKPDSRWGTMYAEQRLLPYARQAEHSDALSTAGRLGIERVAARLSDGVFDDDAPPARIHGDLWSGNVITTDADMIMIDPAAQGGHRLSDLAMLELFGFGELKQVYTGYAATSDRLPEGWRGLLGLHQLHYLLVHAVLLGGGYGPRAAQLAQRYS